MNLKICNVFKNWKKNHYLILLTQFSNFVYFSNSDIFQELLQNKIAQSTSQSASVNFFDLLINSGHVFVALK